MSAPIALTCGEPGGVGPELAVAARAALPDLAFFWIGDPRHLPPDTRFALIDNPAQTSAVPRGVLPVMRHDFAAPNPPGVLVPGNAKGVIEVIERAVAFAMNGQASAVCTAPLHKKALKDGAGFGFPGHTEFLAHLAGVENVVMMLASPLLRVVPATIHIALCDVAASLTPAVLEQVLRITHAGLIRDFGLTNPHIAVAGLNPHAGEGGAMGHEEINIIAPTLDRLRAQGFALSGPLSADTMFHPRARAGYDAAVCMYHDQALIPIKTLDFDGGVNVTLGLPFIRTSPDHGTACDIAGKGVARPDSLIAALKLADEMAQTRARKG
jgi:4-hydroxythreonine-4-phosphate dehydrogenase